MERAGSEGKEGGRAESKWMAERMKTSLLNQLLWAPLINLPLIAMLANLHYFVSETQPQQLDDVTVHRVGQRIQQSVATCERNQLD